MNRWFALLILVATPAVAQTPPPYPRAGRVDAALRTAIDRDQIVGLAAVVLDGGEIAWSRGYGLADREAGRPVDPATTQFRWASISKSVTAIAALQLADSGLLNLDADVRTYVPEFPDKGVKITPRQLLSHQGGIVHYSNGPVIRTERANDTPHPFSSVVTALDRFKDSPLVAPPGERYRYSTHGYVLLSAVVERAGQQPFADQVRERIAGPLGMTHFRPDHAWEDIPDRAAGYQRQGGTIRRRPASEDEDVSWKLGGGGYTSPALDLARFGRGLLHHLLVSPKTEAQMWTVVPPAKPEGKERYGLGFFVLDRPGGAKWVGHDGSQARSKTALLLDPARGKGVAIMTGSEWADAMKLALTLMDEIE